jgi:hypothetical protein
MSNQHENAKQQPLTSEELRQNILTQIETTKHLIAELSDEELESVAGGNLTNLLHGDVKGFLEPGARASGAISPWIVR